jgi:polygalacturonase
MHTLRSILLTGVALLSGNVLFAQVYNIKDFGAVADGKTMNTKAIQQAINKCSKQGGEVLVPEGTFLTGTLYLRDNVKVSISENAKLLGSASFADYPDNQVTGYKNAFTNYPDGRSHTNKAMFFAEGVKNITLTGKGTIDGNGKSPAFDLGNDSRSPQSRSRPCMILLVDCKNIAVTDLHLTNSAYWLQNYLGCDGLQLKRLTIYNHANWNVDGIDIDSKNVLVEDCKIDVDDDGICLKSHDANRACENVVVRNCEVASNCNAIKFGTVGIGGFKNINISNCIIHKASEDKIRHWQQNLKFIGEPITVIAGIALEAVDGGIIDNVRINNIQMQDVQTPIFIVLGNRGSKQVNSTAPPPVSQIRNISINNVTASSQSKMCSSVTAFPGYYAENIELSNISLNDMGNGTPQEGNITLKENPKAYPENRMYGEVYPASGLFVRHVKNLKLYDITFKTQHPDARPAIILDDVQGAQLNKVIFNAPQYAMEAIRVINSKAISVSSPKLSPEKAPLLRLINVDEKQVTVKGMKTYPGLINH